MSFFEMLNNNYAAPPPAPEKRSTMGEIWSQLKAGAFADMPHMVGKAIQYTSSPGGMIYETGRDIADSAAARGAMPEYQPSAASDSTVTGALAKGARMIPQSIAPAVGAGLILTGAGAPAGAALLAGSAIAAAPAGLAQAQETYEKGLAKYGLTPEQATAMPDDPRVKEATTAARMTGAIEYGGEMAGSALAGRFLGVGGGMAKSAIGKLLNQGEHTAAQSTLRYFTNPGTIRRFVGNTLETTAGETLTEMGQRAGEAAVEQHYGYSQQTPLEAAGEAIAPTLGMSAILAPFGIPAHASHAVKMRAITSTLQNPGIDPKTRSQAADIIYNELAKTAPDAAENFATHAFDAIHGTEETGSAPYSLNLDDSVLQPLTPMALQEAHQSPPEAHGPLSRATATTQAAPLYSLKQNDTLAQPERNAILETSTQGGTPHESLDAGRIEGVQPGQTSHDGSATGMGRTALERFAFHDPTELVRTIETTPVLKERFGEIERRTLDKHFHNPAFWQAMAKRQPDLAAEFIHIAANLDTTPAPLPIGAQRAARLAADSLRLKLDPTFEQQASDLNNQEVQDLAARWYQERGEQSPFFRLWSRNAPVVSLDNAPNAADIATGDAITVKGWHTSPGTINRYHKEFSGAHSGFETKGWIWLATQEGAQEHGDGVQGIHGDSYTTEQFYQRMKNPKVIPLTGKGITRAAMEKAQEEGHDGVLLTTGGRVVNAVVFDPRDFKAIDNRGTFNASEYSRYSLQDDTTDNHQQNPGKDTRNSDNPSQTHIDLDAVLQAFPGQAVTPTDDGFTVSLKNGAAIRIASGEISFNLAAAEAAYGREIGANEKPVAEFRPLKQGAIITLTEQGTGELNHETFHAAMHLALNDRQRAAILKKFGTEEAAAAEYQRLRDSGALTAKKRSHHLFLQIIHNFFARIRTLIDPTSAIMSDIASGKAWDKTTEQTGAPATTPAYSMSDIRAKSEEIAGHLKRAANNSTFIQADIAPALKSAGEGMAGAWDGIKAATAPMQRSDAAEEVGRILIEGMGRMEHGKEKFITELNKAARETTHATTKTALAMDLMQSSITLADKVFNRMAGPERIAFMQAMDTGESQASPELQRIADAIGTMFEQKATAIRNLGTGILENARDSYFPHIWKKGEEVSKEINTRLSKRPLEGSKTFSKARVFEDIQTGLDAGFELVSTNPIDLVMLKMAEMDKYLNAHLALQAMEESGLVELIPAGERMPEGYGDISGKYGMVTKRAHQDTETGSAGEEKSYRYVAREDVAQVFNNYLSHNLYTNKYIGRPFTAYMKAANTLNQFQLGVFSAFHAGFTSLEAVISHAALGIKALTRGDMAEAGHYFKHAPAAWYLNPKLGDKVLKAWMGDEEAARQMPQMIEWLTMAGARRTMDSRFQTDHTQAMLQAWSDGNKTGAGVRIIPAIVEQSARPIMEWLVPRQKLGVFAEMANEWSGRHPDASHKVTRKAMQQIWNRVDSRLGQVHYDRLFIHNVAKNLTQALIRAPGWTGGTILEVGGGIKDIATFVKETAQGKKPELSDRAAYTLSLLTTTAIANAALTVLFTGEPPQDWKDLLAFRTGKKDEKGNPERFMLPTYAKDVYAYAMQPGATLLHKSHPMLSLIGDLARNKDYYGVEIRHEGDNPIMQLAQAGKFTAKAFVPFWMKGAGKEIERGNGIMEIAAPLVGVMPAPASMNQTPAERLAHELTRARLPQGSKTAEEFERSQLAQHLTGLARRDQSQARSEIATALQERKINRLQAAHIMHNARLTPIQAAFKRLSYDEALKVFEIADDKEKAQLKIMMNAKRSHHQATA